MDNIYYLNAYGKLATIKPQKKTWGLKSLTRWICYAGTILLASILFSFLVLNAAEQESIWQQERLCRYYAEEVNAHALKKGESKPCQN